MMQYSNTTQQLSPTPSMTIREQQLADPETRLTALAAAVTFLLSNHDNYNNNYTCKQKKGLHKTTAAVFGFKDFIISCNMHAISS